MSTVSMEDFRPPGRNDHVPWTEMQIEESADGVTTLGLIESKLLASGTGVDPIGLDDDPKYPVARDWTTSFATLAPGIGYYRVRFRDGVGNLSEYSDWVKSGLESWVPSLREVAVHIRNRTVERATNRFAGTFTDKTRPTEEEAWEAVQLALDDIEADTGALNRTGIGPVSWKAVRALAALRAAMLIERSYYSEQIGASKSPYPGLERDWERRLPKVVDAVAEDIAGEVEPTPDDPGSTGGGTTPTVDKDLVVRQGSNVLTRTGQWARESANPQYTLPDNPNNVDWNTRF